MFQTRLRLFVWQVHFKSLGGHTENDFVDTSVESEPSLTWPLLSYVKSTELLETLKMEMNDPTATKKENREKYKINLFPEESDGLDWVTLDDLFFANLFDSQPSILISWFSFEQLTF